jgi:hypothetical protein
MCFMCNCVERSPYWDDSRSAIEDVSSFMEPEGSYPCSQELAIGYYTESAESSSYLHAVFKWCPF